MQHGLTLTLIAALLGVTACAGFSRNEVGLLAAPDATLTAPCPDLRSNPGRELTQSDVEIMWGADRRAARICSARHAALTTWATGVVEIYGASGPQ